jgi:hypothetical protein
MFGIGPMEMMILGGGLCCVGVAVAGIIALVAAINHKERDE